MQPKTIIIDIEGTTTPISFVSDILFPFAAQQFGTFLEKNWTDPNVISDVDALFSYEPQTEEKTIPVVTKIAENLIERDVKLTPLKSLQGKIWRAGYESGELRGQLFEEVAECIKKWAKTHRLFIYSSGSVEAQKLLFGYSEAGDLCPNFEGYFDTKIGSKKESSSYVAIADNLKLSSSDLYFLTDSEIEAKSAIQAGWNVIIMTRPGNSELVDTTLEGVKRCNDFNEVARFWNLSAI